MKTEVNQRSTLAKIVRILLGLLSLVIPILVSGNLIIQFGTQTTGLKMQSGANFFEYEVYPRKDPIAQPLSLYWYYYNPKQGTPIDIGNFSLTKIDLSLAAVSPLAVNVTNLVILLFWVGSILLLRQRDQEPAIVLMFLLAQAIGVALIYPLAHYPTYLSIIIMLLIKFSAFFLITPLLLNYVLTFPIPIGSLLQRRWGFGLLYAMVPLALLVWLLGGNVGWQIAAGYSLIIAATAIGAMFYIYFYRASHDDRRRLRLIVFGTLLSGAPPILLYLLPAAFNSPYIMPEWLASLFLVIAPISYLYATTRHNLFGIDRLLNRSLVYIILSLGIFALYLGPFLLLYGLLPNNLLAQILTVSAVTLFVGWSFDWARTRVQHGVDRLFYGGWYDYQGVVETISDALARSVERDQIFYVLTQQVPKLMKLHSADLWIGKSNATYPATPPLQERFRFKFQSEVPAQWTLGPHQDGDDLSESDRRILNTLAHQAEIALNNILLIETLRTQLDEIQESRQILSQTQRQLLRSREDERARLSRELHDNPIQSLVGMNIQLGLLLNSEHVQAPLHDALGEMRSEVRALTSELRQVCANLRPPMLDALGLGAALRAYTENWSAEHGVKTKLDLEADSALRQLPSEVALNLYRVAQEALTNVARHARASQAIIRLHWEDDQLSMYIIDDGCGFRPPDTFSGLTEKDHYGVVGMRERVDLIGGEWKLRSEPQKGTTIKVIWPTQKTN